jgi:hypothetical protein
MKMSQLRDDLIAAKALIDTPEKWRKDNERDYKSCCAIIACNRAAGKTSIHYPAAHRLAEALPTDWVEAHREQERQFYTSIGDEPGFWVGDYNDDPDTTHSDIMALFDRAIEAAQP